MNVSGIDFEDVLPVLYGAIAGVGCAVFSTTAQKVCMLAGVEFEKAPDEDEILPSERLEKEFKDLVIVYPLKEEAIFRGLLQPLFSYGLKLYVPHLKEAAFLGFSQVSLISSLATGILFGLTHYSFYKKGGRAVATIGSVVGFTFGVLKERFHLISSIAAHMSTNLTEGLIDKYYPTLLESEEEKALREKKGK